MKSILFMVINMNIGGMEKALLSMISEMPLDKYKITVLMLEEYGGFLKDIPDGINIEFLDLYKDIKAELNNPPISLAIQYMKNKRIFRGLNILILHTITKLLKDRSLYFKYLLKNYDTKDEIYDIAVAYAGPNDFISYFIINKITAKKKVQWIHFDVTKIGFNLKYSTKIYKRFDKIFVVSKEAKEKLDSLIPSIRKKTEVFKNIISKKIITEKAKFGDSFDDNFDGIRILTVGRLSKEKGQDITIPVLAQLRESGYNVRWYCVGEGNLRGACEKLIKEYNVENDYILLGASLNPYAYMKDCDIYVQSSRHEGYCITLAEARCFNNPIVSTNFTGAKEQIDDGVTGIIVNCNRYSLFENIRFLLDDKIRLNCNKSFINNVEEIEKLYTFIN